MLIFHVEKIHNATVIVNQFFQNEENAMNCFKGLVSKEFEQNLPPFDYDEIISKRDFYDSYTDTAITMRTLNTQD